MKVFVIGLMIMVLMGAAALWNRASGGTQDGSCLETWELINFQPLSASHGESVKSSSYHSRTTVVLFLASW